MTLLRSWLYILGQVVSIIVYLPVTLLSRLLPAAQGNKLVGGWARFNIWWLGVTCGLRHEVRGLENFPDRPVVILSKHQSAWETIAFQTLFPPIAYVIKRELLWIPFFGWGLAASHAIAINRDKARAALDTVIRQGTNRLELGLSVCIFPEGTRMPPGERGRYNPGGAMLAVKAGVPVVPVAHNAGHFWARNGIKKHPGTVQVVVGPPIDTTGRKARDVNAEAEQWIEAACDQLATGTGDIDAEPRSQPVPS